MLSKSFKERHTRMLKSRADALTSCSQSHSSDVRDVYHRIGSLCYCFSSTGLQSVLPQHTVDVIYSKTPPPHPTLPYSFPPPSSVYHPILLSVSQLISSLLGTERGFHFRECLLLCPEMAEPKSLK